VDLCILSEDTNDVRGYRVALRCPHGGNSHDCFDYNNCALHVWFDTRKQAANEFLWGFAQQGPDICNSFRHQESVLQIIAQIVRALAQHLELSTAC
jgi:hypothetical protein